MDLRDGYLGTLPRDIRCLVREYLIQSIKTSRRWTVPVERYLYRNECYSCVRAPVEVMTVFQYDGHVLQWHGYEDRNVWQAYSECKHCAGMGYPQAQFCVRLE